MTFWAIASPANRDDAAATTTSSLRNDIASSFVAFLFRFPSELNCLFVAIEHGVARCTRRRNPDRDCARKRGGIRSIAQRKRQPLGTVVPGHGDFAVLARLLGEAGAVSLINGRGALGPR